MDIFCVHKGESEWERNLMKLFHLRALMKYLLLVRSIFCSFKLAWWQKINADLHKIPEKKDICAISRSMIISAGLGKACRESCVDCKLLKRHVSRQRNRNKKFSGRSRTGQMTYLINSSEINTRLYDFRAKKRKIWSGSRKGQTGRKYFTRETRDGNKKS